MGGAYHHNLISSVLALFSPAKLSGHGDEEISPARSAVAPQPRHRARRRAPATPPRPPPRLSPAGLSSSRSSGGPRLSDADDNRRRPHMLLSRELGLPRPSSAAPKPSAAAAPGHARGTVGHEASCTSSDYRAPATRRRPQGTLRCAQAAPPPSPGHARGTVAPPRGVAMVLRGPPLPVAAAPGPLAPPAGSARVAVKVPIAPPPGPHSLRRPGPRAPPAKFSTAAGQVLHGCRPSSPRPPAMFPPAAALGQAKMATLGARAGAGRALRWRQGRAALSPLGPCFSSAAPRTMLLLRWPHKSVLLLRRRAYTQHKHDANDLEVLPWASQVATDGGPRCC
nr:uncharacterized protein LOC127303510 [Lolium perenne]